MSKVTTCALAFGFIQRVFIKIKFQLSKTIGKNMKVGVVLYCNIRTIIQIIRQLNLRIQLKLSGSLRELAKAYYLDNYRQDPVELKS